MSVNLEVVSFLKKNEILEKVPLTIYMISKLTKKDFVNFKTARNDHYNTKRMKCKPFYKSFF